MPRIKLIPEGDDWDIPYEASTVPMPGDTIHLNFHDSTYISCDVVSRCQILIEYKTTHQGVESHKVQEDFWCITIKETPAQKESKDA